MAKGVVSRPPLTVNDRVRPTDRAVEQGIVPDLDVRGTVRGFGLSPTSVRVQLDGRKSTITYSMNFWTKADE